MFTELKDVLGHFTGFNTFDDVVQLKSGLINGTWKVTLDKQAYIIQQINTEVFKNPAYIDHNCRLIRNFLEHRHPNYFLPLPMTDGQGSSLFRHPTGKYFRIQHYVIDSLTVLKADNAKQAFEAANTFGGLTVRLHEMSLDDFKAPISDFHNLPLRYSQYEHALKHGFPDRISRAFPAVKALEDYRYLLFEFQVFRRISDFKQRIMHHDTKISNVLFNANDEAICAIDLDTLMPGYLWSDIGDMVRTFVSPVSEEAQDLDKIYVRIDILNAIYAGYLTAMQHLLSKAEIKSMPLFGCIMTYMQALRFLTDYLLGDVYYGSSYEDHNLFRAKNQIKLLAELDRVKGHL